jgi:formylglycine-generating enzyme
MRAALLVAAMSGSAAVSAADHDWARIPATEAFASVLKYEDTQGTLRVEAFELSATPVTNAQYLAFVRQHPQWQRGRAPAVLADARYLQHWDAPLQPGQGAANQPVVWVSWFAAQAYCEAQGARLPTWSEWEVAAAADATRADARRDPAWRERMLSWYSRPGDAPLPPAGQGAATVHGVHDLHSLVWEWVEDYSAMLVSADNRQQGDADKLRFCGAAGLSTDDRENYAVLMRVAMLSSLQAADTTANLGFRCARDLPEIP